MCDHLLDALPLDEAVRRTQRDTRQFARKQRNWMRVLGWTKVTDPLESALAGAAGRDVHLYVCGPTPMMRAVARLATTRGVPCDVSLEQVMGCGLGGCYSCVVLARDTDGAPRFVRSCLEGPVFDASRIVWNALAH